ncbi:MAG: DUF2911 domain-containing protein [Bacteroidota bacterium]
MKACIFPILLFLLGALMLPAHLSAQKFPNLDKSSLDIASFPKRGANKVVRVTYSRPFKNDREIFGGKVKYGKVWRLGANEASEITFYKDVTIDGQSIKAGTYALFAIPNETEWTIIFNSRLNQWGAFTYKEKHDVARVTASVSTADEILENFSISFDKNSGGATMYFGWDLTIAALPMKF